MLITVNWLAVAEFSYILIAISIIGVILLVLYLIVYITSKYYYQGLIGIAFFFGSISFIIFSSIPILLLYYIAWMLRIKSNEDDYILTLIDLKVVHDQSLQILDDKY